MKYSNIILTALLCCSLSFATDPDDPKKFDPSSFELHPNETVLELSVSGKHGIDARDGSSYSGRASRRSRGQTGGDATNSTAGQSAGDIDISLNLENKKHGWYKGIPFDAQVIIRGVIQKANGRAQNISSKLKMRLGGFLKLFSRGGNGGHGGRGGNGEQGGKGSDGSDATRYSSGGNGGRGATGGSNGLGSSGSGAGDGGKIIIRVNHDETQLLHSIYGDINAGSGGNKGTHGQVGSGGPGGDGGSSHTWTEYYSETEYYTDSEGRSQSRSVQKSRSHYQPGGSDGPRGSSGSRRSKNITSGQNGHNGKIEFHVTNADGSVSIHEKIYDIELLGFDFNDTDSDNHFEPGEKVSVKNIKVKNVGGMPLPKGRNVHIFIQNSSWVISDAITLQLPTELAPGAVHTFTDENLSFQVKDTLPKDIQETPFKVHDAIDPDAIQSGTLTYYEGFNNPQGFEVTYPIEVTPIHALRSIEPGTGSKISWNVKNISTKKFGTMSELKRALSVKLRTAHGNAVEPKDIVFFDADNNPINMEDGFFKAIAGLEPGKSTLVNGVLGFTKDAPTHEKLRLDLDLNIDSQLGQNKTIQRPHFKVNVTQVYKKTPGSKYLLVVNNETEKKAVEGMAKLAKNLGTAVDIWDLSHYGMLDMNKLMLGSGPGNDNIMQDFTGQTIIFLDNPFHTNQGEVVNSTHFLAKKQFLEAASQYGINFVVIQRKSARAENIFNNYMLPTHKSTNVKEMTYDDFMKSIKTVNWSEDKKTEEKILEGGSLSNEIDINEITYKLKANELKIFGKVKEEHLTGYAEYLNKYLLQEKPAEKYISITHFKPKVLKTWLWGLVKRYELGEITVRQGLSTDEANAIMMSVDDFKSFDSGNFFHSEKSYFSMLIGLSFKEKLEVIYDYVHNTADDKNILFDARIRKQFINAIMYDLVAEQTTYRMFFWNKHKRKELKIKLSKLQSFVEKTTPFTHTPSSIEGKFFSELIGNISAFTNAQTAWYNFMLPGTTDGRVSNITRKLINKWIDNNFSKKFKEVRNNFITDVKTARDQELKIYAEIKEKKQKLKDVAKSLYLDTDLVGHDPRELNEVMTAQEYNNRARLDNHRQKKLDTFVENEKDAVAALKVELDCNNHFLPKT